jgi:hypothetical protein
MYSFDGDLRDDSGNGNDGTALGEVSFTQGVIGQAVKLGGISHVGLVTVPNSQSLALSSELTYACFVRIDSSIGQTSQDCTGRPVEGAPQCVFAKRGDRDGLWANVYVTPASGTLTAAFGVNSYTIAQVGVETSFPYGVGSWIHLAFVCSSGQVIVYADGLEVARETCPPADFSAANESDLYIGVQRNTGEACPAFLSDWWYPLDGAIDDLRVYSRILSASEIAALARPSGAGTAP